MIRLSRTVLTAVVALSACGEPGQPQEVRNDPNAAKTSEELADASYTDTLADAPWRVQSLDTVIPFSLIIGDAYSPLLGTDLNSARITLVADDGSESVVFFRNFGGLELDEDLGGSGLWYMLITRTAESDFGDGLPITARTLVGEGAQGKTLRFHVRMDVGVSARVNINDIHLAVRVGDAPLPHGHGKFAGWYAGDTHVHSMYTHNWVEFGAPHRGILAAGKAIGLDWTITTDHSCDLDEPKEGTAGIGYVSDRTAVWRFCEGHLPWDECVLFDHRGWENGWEMAASDALEAEEWDGNGTFSLHAAEEVNVLSSSGETIHLLTLNSGYVESKGSGADAYGVYDPVTASLDGVMASLPDSALAFAAHPTQQLAKEIAGGAWHEADVAAAVEAGPFYGFELWNMRKTRSAYVEDPYDGAGVNPHDVWQPCSSEDRECFPYFLEREAVPLWDRHLSSAIASGGPKLFGIAGSDAHGDFNFMTKTSDGWDLDGAVDSAYGKVRTVVKSSSRSMGDILDALRLGRCVMTDGPMMDFGVDRSGDGTLSDLSDALVGATVENPVGATLPLMFEWESTAEFGQLEHLYLVRGTAESADEPEVYDLLVDSGAVSDCPPSDRMSGSCIASLVPQSALSSPGLGQTYYYRAVATSRRNTETFRAITNPIWVVGVEPTPEASHPSIGIPCPLANECPVGYVCLEDGDRYCTVACGGEREPCPAGYVCDERMLVCARVVNEQVDEPENDGTIRLSCAFADSASGSRSWSFALFLVMLVAASRRRLSCY